MRSTSWPMMCAVFAIFFALVSETSAQSSSLQIKGPRDAQGQFSGATYGPIDAADTLWGISSRYRQNQALSVYQVMVAIYELNPEAFERQNLNLLVDGAVLRLPSERYVSRIDAQQAQLRAQQDDQALGIDVVANEPVANTNIKPPTELVNKSDLNDTKNQIEQQISRLDDQQIEQFEFLRQQFAASIDNVEALIDENRKVFERLDAVNQDITDLRTQVDQEVKPQIDQQIVLQQELLDLIKSAEAREQEKEASSWTQYLTNPMTLIIGSTLLMLLLVGGLVLWLLKRNSSSKDDAPIVASAPTVNAPMATQPHVDDLSDSLVEDLAIPDADDDLFNDDELLDDVLSEELEESLDDAVENELENYADLSDEMLVPDIEDDSDSLFEDDDDELLKELDDVDLDELDSIDLSDDNDIDLADSINDELDDELVSELDAAVELEDDSLDDLFEEDELSDLDNDLVKELTSDEDIDALLDADIAEQIESPEIDTDEKPEISIDELLDDPAGSDDTPSGIEVDVETGVSSQMLEQLEDEVASQNAEIDKVSDEILNELEQLEMMQGMMGDDDLMDDDEEESPPEPVAEVQQDIQSLDEFSKDLDDIDTEDLGELDDTLSDDLLAELGAVEESQDILADDTDAMADELLSELGVDSEVEEQAIEEVIDDSDALADELLAELGVDDDDNTPNITETAETDTLTDDLLEELSVEANDSVLDVDDDSETDVSTEALLDELAIDDEDIAPEAEQTTDADALTDELLDELSIEGEDIAPEAEQTTDADALTDELLDELSIEDEGIASEPEQTADELTDELLEEFEIDEEVLEVAGKDTDETTLTAELDEIPSFALDEDSDNGIVEEFAVDDEIDDSLVESALEEFDFEDDTDTFEIEDSDSDLPKSESIDDLDDLPGLGDWLSTEDSEDSVILEEIEGADFDDLLESIDSEVNVESELKLDNPDLDLDALFTDPEDIESEGDSDSFVDVDTLLEESAADDGSRADETNLNLDVALSEFSGVSEDDVVVDVDVGGTQAANLDLAQAYIEMDDKDAAIELLKEVSNEGTDEQKQEAQTILEKLT